MNWSKELLEKGAQISGIGHILYSHLNKLNISNIRGHDEIGKPLRFGSQILDSIIKETLVGDLNEII